MTDRSVNRFIRYSEVWESTEAIFFLFKQQTTLLLEQDAHLVA